MGNLKQTKINQLLKIWPQGSVATSSWLKQQGISKPLQERYRKSGWLESIGRGALKRADDKINWQGGLYALQNRAKLPVHAGGLTSVSIQGSGHFIRFKEKIQLFSDNKTAFPKWFLNYQWDEEIQLCRTSFLPGEIALKKYDNGHFEIYISTLERAILECLYLAPKHMDTVECYYIMEGLVGLRPDVLQELLEQCKSVKVKRLFFYMAEKANHVWLKYIDTQNISFGSGKRNLVKGGQYNAKYKITLPRELKDIQ